LEQGRGGAEQWPLDWNAWKKAGDSSPSGEWQQCLYEEPAVGPSSAKRGSSLGRVAAAEGGLNSAGPSAGVLATPAALETKCAEAPPRAAVAAVVGGAAAEARGTAGDPLQELRADMSKLESRMREGLAAAYASLTAFESRLLQLEQREEQEGGGETGARLQPAARRLEEVPPLPALRASSADTAEEELSAGLRTLVEQRLQDMACRVEQAVEDGREVRISTAALDEQMKMLRAIVEARESNLRALSDRVGNGDWASKLEGLRQAVLEEGKERGLQMERVELLERRLVLQEQVQEELWDDQQRYSQQLPQQLLFGGAFTPACSSPWSSAYIPSPREGGPREGSEAAVPPPPVTVLPRPPSAGGSGGDERRR